MTEIIPEQPRVLHNCDYYLLDKWDAGSAETEQAQAATLFQEYVALGVEGRKPYWRSSLTERSGLLDFKTLPQPQKDLYLRVRHSREWRYGVDWVRTCYHDAEGNSTDEAYQALMAKADPYGDVRKFAFDDATRYDFGQDWTRIFGFMPQLADCYKPESYEDEKLKALKEAHEWDEEESEDLEENGYTWSEDGTPWLERYSYFHQRAKVGHLWIVDDEALQPNGEILLVWFDDKGRVVRKNRIAPEEIEEARMILDNAWFNERSVWTEAEPGELYDWDGPFGPPALAYEGEERNEEELEEEKLDNV